MLYMIYMVYYKICQSDGRKTFYGVVFNHVEQVVQVGYR